MALVIGNLVYLDDVPPGGIRVAAAASQQCVAGALQAFLPRMAALLRLPQAPVFRRHAVDAAATKDARAVLHIPGLWNTGDIASIAFEEARHPRWRRVSPQPASLATEAHQG